MLHDDGRRCDICDAMIPRGATFHVGYTTPDTLKSWFSDMPKLMPKIAEEPDGTIRIDVCAECVEESDALAELTEATVDVLH